MLLTSEGKCYNTGADLLGLLGDGDYQWKDASRFQELTILDKYKLIDIGCAEYHSLAVIENGDVYSWGGSLHSVKK